MKLDSRQIKKILYGVVALQVVILGITMYFVFSRDGGSSTSGGGSSSSSSLLPIWVAVFIPIWIANKKKNKTESQKSKQYMLLLGLGLFVLFGMIIFLFFAKR